MSGCSEAAVRTAELLGRGSFSIDGELIGAYPRNRDASSSNRTGDASCDSQPKTLRVASTDTEQTCDEAEDGERATREQRAGPTTLEPIAGQVESRTDPTDDQIAEDGVESYDAVPKTSTTRTIRSGCSCEGACGCATEARVSTPVRPVRRLSAERNVTEEEQRRENYRNIEEREAQAEEKEETEEEESCSRSRSAIIRLLGGKAGRWQSGSGSPTVASTASSTPCGGTLRRSASRFPVCSRDNYIGRMSTIGSTSSYEKLSNREFEVEFELGRERGSMRASDPAAVGSARCEQRRRGRRYSSCDLESLCEGIKALDGFLARRGLTMTHGRKQSVTVMLFGTPDHGTIRRRAAGETETGRQIARVSRFSLDAVSN